MILFGPMSVLSAKKVVFGSDHGGFHLKGELLVFAKEQGAEVYDSGCFSEASIDYPDVARDAVKVFDARQADFLILICGSGIGVSIAANRYSRIRAVVTDNIYAAKLARQHNHANCLCMGARLTGPDQAREVFLSFVSEEVDTSERHARRVAKLGELNE